MSIKKTTELIYTKESINMTLVYNFQELQCQYVEKEN